MKSDSDPVGNAIRRRRPIEPGGALSGALFRDLSAPGPAGEATLGTVIGPWRTLALLGRGGSSVVYLAERADERFHQRVALKVCDPSERLSRYVRREREILSSLSHPGIARLVDGGEEADGRIWFAMEPVYGQPIDEFCAARQLPWKKRIELIRSVCDALQYAHGRLLIHRDIKPSNVLVDEVGRTKLLDFGIAVRSDESAGDHAMTLRYSSPEQRRGGTISVASDIYQMGLLLRALVTPVADAIGAGARQDLDLIVAKATSEGPEDRYSTAAALSADLDAVVARRPISLRNGLAYVASRLIGRNIAVFGTVGVSFALLCILGATAAMRLRDQRNEAEQAARQATQARAQAEAVSEFLVNIFSSADPAEARGAQMTASQILTSAERRLAEKYDHDPALRAALSLELGRVFSALSEHKRAVAVLERALLQAQAAGLGDALHLARLESQLGTTYYTLGDYPKARAALQRAGTHIPGIASPIERDVTRGLLLNREAILEKRIGNLDIALAKQTSALHVLEKTLGISHRSTLAALNNMGNLHYALGDFDRAVAILTRCRAAEVEYLGLHHPLTQQTTNNLANALLAADEVGQAETFLAEASAIDDTLGTAGTERAQTLALLSEVERRRRRFERAEALSQQAREVFSTTLHPDHAAVLGDAERRGAIALDRGDSRLAATLFDHVLERRLAISGEANQYVANTLDLLGEASLASKDFERAEAHFRRAVAIRTRISPGAAIWLGREQLGLGLALSGQGKYAEASIALEEAARRFDESKFPLTRDRAVLATARRDIAARGR